MLGAICAMAICSSWAVQSAWRPAVADARVLQHTNQEGHLHKSVPAYAKWGQLAVAETKKRYKDANVVDYLHVGRTKISSTDAQEAFKLWLRGEKGEFGVLVKIQFNEQTDKVTNMSFAVVNR